MIEFGNEYLINPDLIECVVFAEKNAMFYARSGNVFVVDYVNCSEEKIREKLHKPPPPLTHKQGKAGE